MFWSRRTTTVSLVRGRQTGSKHTVNIFMILLKEYPTTQNTLQSVNFTIYISLAWHKEWLTVFFQPQKQFWFQTSSSAISDIGRNFRFITPPARRAWRSYKFASLRFSVLFSVSQVGLPLMCVTAVDSCLAEHVAKTHHLTCILQQHLSSKKVIRSKTRIQNIL